MGITLQIGRTYKRRGSDQTVTITGLLKDQGIPAWFTEDFPFFGSDRCSYAENGRFLNQYETPFDLVEEITPNA